MAIVKIRRDITIDKYATFSNTYAMVDANNDPVNITGYTANAYLRKEPTSNTYQTFTCTISGSNLILSMSSSNTGDINNNSKQIYDVLLTDLSGAKQRVIEGFVYVTPAITY